jgi:ABC-type oligopeptide transport system ATPase subunit
VSNRIAVMYLGNLVELSPAAELYRGPIMPYTEALLFAVPIPDPDLSEQRACTLKSAGRLGTFARTERFCGVFDETTRCVSQTG